MRYEYVGKKISLVGKTLWEIVGNLKNFGVGRLIKRSASERFNEVCFIKILKIQPLPPPKKEGQNRKVLMTFEEVHRGIKALRQSSAFTDVAKFQLIPKIEEAEYLRRAAETKPPEKLVKMYSPWPPLYKKLWEDKQGQKGSIPKLKLTIIDNGFNYIFEEAEAEKIKCSLYKTSQTVDEMYKEIVRLKKLIKSQKNVDKSEDS